MGWCHEFGTQVHLGCDHPMTAGPDACHCDECGFVCTGKFTGCADVWASGPRAATVLRPLERPVLAQAVPMEGAQVVPMAVADDAASEDPVSLPTAVGEDPRVSANRIEASMDRSSAPRWSRLRRRSPARPEPPPGPEPGSDVAPEGTGSMSEPARVAPDAEPDGDPEGQETTGPDAPEETAATEGPTASPAEAPPPDEGRPTPPDVTPAPAGPGDDWPRMTGPATTDDWWTPADWPPVAAQQPPSDQRGSGDLPPSPHVEEAGPGPDLAAGLAGLRAELLGSLQEAVHGVKEETLAAVIEAVTAARGEMLGSVEQAVGAARDDTRETLEGAVTGARTEMQSWLDDAFAAVRGELRSWLNDAFGDIRSDLARMDSDLREQRSALEGLAETVSSRLRLAELISDLPDRLASPSPEAEDASRRLEETVDEARSVLGGMQLAAAAVRAELEQLTELRQQLLRDAAAAQVPEVAPEPPSVPPALLEELAETARAGQRLGDLVEELPDRIAESIADVLEVEPAEADQEAAPAGKNAQRSAPPDIEPAEEIRGSAEPPVLPLIDVSPSAADAPGFPPPEPVFEPAAEEIMGPGFEPESADIGLEPAPVGAEPPDLSPPLLRPGPPAEPPVPTAPPRQAPAPKPPEPKSPLRRLRGRRHGPTVGSAPPSAAPDAAVDAGAEPPVPWEPGQAPPPLAEEEATTVGDAAAMDRFFAVDEAAAVDEAVAAGKTVAADNAVAADKGVAADKAGPAAGHEKVEEASDRDRGEAAAGPGPPDADRDVFDVEGLLDLPLTSEEEGRPLRPAAPPGEAEEPAVQPPAEPKVEATAKPGPDRRATKDGDQPAPAVVERRAPPETPAQPPPRPRYRAKTLTRLVDGWESIMRQFVEGGTTRSPEVEPWFAAYSGEVHYDALPEPFVGSLAAQPKAVLLSLNPGPAFAHLHARDGRFATEIKRAGSYAGWVAEGPDPDVPYGRKNTNASRLRFVEGWLDSEPVAATDLVTFELYPWPATAWTSSLDLNPVVLSLLDRFVLEPVAALRPPWVFAFGVEWFRALDGLGFVERVTVGGDQGPTWTGAAPSRVVTVFEHERKRLRVVAMRHRGSAGPPKPAEVAPLRDLLARSFNDESATRSKPRSRSRSTH